MKKISILLLKSMLTICIATSAIFSLQAQSKNISNATKQALQSHKELTLSLFEISNERDSVVDAGIHNVVYLKLNKQALKEALRTKSNTVAFNIPIEGTSQNILMKQYDIYDVAFRAKTNGLTNQSAFVAKPDGIFYRGFIENDDYSLAAISFFKDELGGVISISGAKGNYNLALNKNNPGANFDQYILYNEMDIIDGNRYIPICKNDDRQEGIAKPTTAKSKTANAELGLSCKTTTISLLGDYKLFQKNQNSLANTQNYLTILFNGVAALYENDGIRIALKELNVNTVDDFYPTNTSNAILEKFGNEVNTNVTADLMQIVTGYTVPAGSNDYAPLGGLAWLNVLCSTPFYYAAYDTYVGPYSMINTTGSPNIPDVPVYSWDIMCATHEFGHNFVSPHTHNCAWNGNNTAIDNCAGTANPIYADNNCAPATNPNTGTIMSYCHLVNGIGINFVNGFGPQPRDLILGTIESASCLNTNFYPNKVLNVPDFTIVANGFCINNDELYCYDTKHDYNRSNDDLIMIIKNSNVNNLDLSTVEISSNTTTNYANNVATDASNYSYVDAVNYTSWFVGNRSWLVKLNQSLPGTTKITLPFLNVDKADLTGSHAPMNGSNDSMCVVLYKTENASLNPATALANDVTVYQFGTAANQWSYATNTNHNTASINTISGFFGATIATGTKLKDLSIRTFVNSKLIQLFPNPTNDYLNLSYDGFLSDLKQIEITDYLGRMVMSIASKSVNEKIDIRNLNTGVYLIKCFTNKGQFINKFIKID